MFIWIPSGIVFIVNRSGHNYTEIRLSARKRSQATKETLPNAVTASQQELMHRYRSKSGKWWTTCEKFYIFAIRWSNTFTVKLQWNERLNCPSQLEPRAVTLCMRLVFSSSNSAAWITCNLFHSYLDNSNQKQPLLPSSNNIVVNFWFLLCCSSHDKPRFIVPCSGSLLSPSVLQPQLARLNCLPM